MRPTPTIGLLVASRSLAPLHYELITRPRRIAMPRSPSTHSEIDPTLESQRSTSSSAALDERQPSSAELDAGRAEQASTAILDAIAQSSPTASRTLFKQLKPEA